jgi:RNA polymerase sigma-70 factor, ECF subfamily
MNISTADYQGNKSSAIEQCLAETFRHAQPALTRRARAIVGNRSDAEDAVQEAVARAWQARDRLRHGSDPLPWLRTIVTRTAIDLARDRSRRSIAPDTDPVSLSPSAEETAVRAETLSAIDSAASRLAPESRRVLYLHDVAGMSSHEIADLDRLPYHTVRTRLRRARISLRNELKKAI